MSNGGLFDEVVPSSCPIFIPLTTILDALSSVHRDAAPLHIVFWQAL